MQLPLANSAGSSGLYSLFYVPTNEYLERPVPVASVANLSVSNVSYTVAVPTSVSLTREGCSSVQTATISAVSTAPIYVRIGAGNLSAYGMYLRDQLDNTIIFPIGSLSQNFTLCANSNSAVGTTVVPIDVIGNNSVQYLTNTNNISVTVSSAAPPVTPVIQTPNFTGQSLANNLTSNRTGVFYWTLQVGNYTAPPNNHTDIQNQVSGVTNNTKATQSQSDQLNHIYPYERDVRIGSTPATAGQNSTLVFTDLRPNTTYTLCAYFSTTGASPVFTNYTCSSMISPVEGWTSYKMLLYFTANQTATQRNALLCTLTDLIGTSTTDQNKYILNQRGESCNRTDSTPANYWYNYDHDTYANASEVVYLIAKDNSTASLTQITNFNNLFDSTTKQLTSGTIQTINSKINSTLKNGTNNGTIPYSAIRSEGRTVTIGNIAYDKATQTLTISNITTNTTSAIYFVLQSNSTNAPSTEQLFNCRDGNNNTAVRCFRWLATTATTVLSFLNAEQPDSDYGSAKHDEPPSRGRQPY